jgi:hypothetical protein
LTGFFFEEHCVKGDYLLKRNSNHSFLINYDRDVVGKVTARDDDEHFLNPHSTEISIKTLSDDLQKKIADPLDKK